MNADAYLAWLLTHGVPEYAALRESPALLGDPQAVGYARNPSS